MSPAMLSIAKSSFTVPTTLSSGSSSTLVVGVVGNRAAGRDRRQPRAAPAAQHAVDRVVMQQRAAPAAPRREALGEHARRPRRTRSRVRSRYGQARRTSAKQLVLAPLAAPRPRRRSAAPARRAAASGSSAGRARRGARCRAAPRTRPARRATAGTAGPSACRRPRGPSGRRAAGSAAIERGEPSWQTRSTSPMSMPSSSDAVATSAFSSPALSRCSASSRCSLRQAAVMRGDALLAEPLGRAAAPRARPGGAC